MLAVRDRLQREADPGARVAGRLDHDIDIGKRDECNGVGAHECPRAARRVAQVGRRELRLAPSARAQLVARALDVEIGEADEMHARRAAHLREKHRAELAGPDQTDANRPAGGFPFHELGVKVQSGLLFQLSEIGWVPAMSRSRHPSRPRVF